MSEEKTEEPKRPIYVTRGANTWGHGDTAMKSFLNCFKQDTSARKFMIVRLPDDTTEWEVGPLGSLNWHSESGAKLKKIEFDADFRDQVRDELCDMLGLSSKLANLLLQEKGSRYDVKVAHDLEQIMEVMWDVDLRDSA